MTSKGLSFPKFSDSMASLCESLTRAPVTTCSVETYPGPFAHRTREPHLKESFRSSVRGVLRDEMGLGVCSAACVRDLDRSWASGLACGLSFCFYRFLSTGEIVAAGDEAASRTRSSGTRLLRGSRSPPATEPGPRLACLRPQAGEGQGRPRQRQPLSPGRTAPPWFSPSTSLPLSSENRAGSRDWL